MLALVMVLASHYHDYALKHRKYAIVWAIVFGVVLAGAAALGVGGRTGWWSIFADETASKALQDLAVFTPAAVFAFFCSRRSIEHRRLSVQAEDVELRLLTARPYFADVTDDASRKEALKTLGEQLLANPLLRLDRDPPDAT